MEQTKRCANCQQELSVLLFWKRRARKNGYQSRCKLCMDLYRKTDEARANRSRRARDWNKRNPARVTASRDRYNLNHPDMRAYHRVHEARYRAQNRESVWKRSYEWLKRHPEKRREYQEKRNGCRGCMLAKQWLDLKAKYGNRCLCCNRAEPEVVLHADHIIPVKLGGSNNVENRQPLCNRCNSRKSAKHIDYRPKE